MTPRWSGHWPHGMSRAKGPLHGHDHRVWGFIGAQPRAPLGLGHECSGRHLVVDLVVTTIQFPNRRLGPCRDREEDCFRLSWVLRSLQLAEARAHTHAQRHPHMYPHICVPRTRRVYQYTLCTQGPCIVLLVWERPQSPVATSGGVSPRCRGSHLLLRVFQSDTSFCRLFLCLRMAGSSS